MESLAKSNRCHGNGRGRGRMPDSGDNNGFRQRDPGNSRNGSNNNFPKTPCRNGHSLGNSSRQAPNKSKNTNGPCSNSASNGAWNSDRGRSRRGQKVEQTADQASTSALNIDSLAPKLESLSVPLPPAPRLLLQEVVKRMPMQRPDRGGSSCIHSLDLLVNHFTINYDHRSVIFYYDIDIKPEKLSNNVKITEVPRFDLLSIKNELLKSVPEQLPTSSVAYDGNRNLYSVFQLPIGQFKVEVNHRKYVATIEFRKHLELHRLAERPAAREVLQALDVIVKESSSWQRIAFGRNLFSKRIDPACDLGRGVAALEGSQQALRLTENGVALGLDYTLLPCPKPGPVLQFLKENLGLCIDENTQLSKQQRLKVENALRGLRVTVTHRDSNQRFTIISLTRLIIKDIKFKDDISGKEVRLVHYYRDKHKKEIKFQRLPCLDLSKNTMNYVPIEFCLLAEGQPYPKNDLCKDGRRKLKDMALTHPRRRKEMILKMINSSDGPCKGEIANQFNISVSKDMTQVRARVLERPDLKVSNSNGQNCKFKIKKDDGQWNLMKNKLFKGQKIDYWAILDFSAMPANPRHESLNVPSFTENLIKQCRDFGINIRDSPLFVQKSSMAVLSDYKWLSEELARAKQSFECHPVQLLICSMSDRHAGYKSLKLICETELGIMTQCCLSFFANNVYKKDQFFANLALKINAKLGGSNVELFDSLPHMRDCPFMLIGADVNHPPSWNTSSASIAAVVATIDYQQSSRYAARVRAQAHRVERIIHLGEMCKELINTYVRFHGVKPEKIIYFRDGVGDGQFGMVLNEELRDLKMAIASNNYSPTITVVVAQKRHHTRLFPKDTGGPSRTRMGNVPPGTVVDTGIVDPAAFNFYLCSHYGSLGTSKPTHYYVLHDEHRFTSDELQRLIYNLCFTFVRCTKPVSLVPPVYYADLVAYRGRLYYEGRFDVRSPTSTASSLSSSASLSSMSSAPASCDHCVLPKPHLNVEDGMYYV